MRNLKNPFRASLPTHRSYVTAPVIALIILATTADYVDDPRRILREADRLAMLSNFSQAAPLFREAEMVSRKSGDHKTALLAHFGYFWAMAEMGRTLKTDSEIDRESDSKLVHSDPDLLLRFLVAKAANERVINEASAHPIWEGIQKTARAARDGRWEARAEAELGEIAYLGGDVRTAVRMLKGALLSELLHRDVGAVIYYSSIVGNGMVEAGQPENGLAYCNAAVKMARLFSGAGFPFLAYQGKARALIALHRFTEAEIVIKSALTEARSQGNLFAEAQLLIVAGDGAQDPTRRVEYLRAASKLSERQGFRHAFAWSTFELAKAYRGVGDIEAAKDSANRALASMQGLEDRYHLPQHLSLLADLNVESRDFDKADQLYKQAAELIDTVLGNAPSPQIESSLISTLSDVYVGQFSLAAEKFKDVREGYEVIERARGRSLSDSLRYERRAFPMIDPVTIAAKKDINSIQLALLRQSEPTKRQELLERLFETEQKFTPIRTPFQTSRGVLVQTRLPSLADLQSKIHSDEVVLEYVLNEPKSFCIRITRATAEIIRLPSGRSAIEQAIDRYLAAIVGGDSGEEEGRWLHSVLVRPAIGRNNRSKLIVVPDGKMNFLPFDSIVDDDGNYLLESHVVSYCPSGTVLFLMRSDVTPATRRMRFLGVADVQYPAAGPRPFFNGRTAALELPDFLPFGGIGFKALPWTRDEVTAASRALGWENTLLLGQDATEARLKALSLPSYRIIHIATHGVPSTEFPDRSALVLAPDELTGEDGLLQAREIRSLPIHAELVVLSACDTGVGSVRGQEGIANLVNAFLYAGARSVVASIWAANDAYTAHLMGLFYAHLAKGEDRSVALQHAKLDSLRRFGSKAIPLYWAGFVIVGEGSSPVTLLQAPDDPSSS